MRKYLFLIVLTLFLSACSNNEVSEKEVNTDQEVTEKIEYIKISSEEAKEMMSDDVLILDVRSQEEFDEGHIEGAVLLPVDEILAGNYGPLTDLDQTILVYCRSGNRSAKAAKALIKVNYSKVYDFGGIFDWPYGIVK